MSRSVHEAPGRSGRSGPLVFTAAALAFALGACSWTSTEEFLKGESRLEQEHQDHSDRRSRVDISDARLAPTEGGRAMLSLALDNTTDEPLWVRLEIDAQRADDECEDSYGLEPHGHLEVDCPQTFKPDQAIYTVEVHVFKDIGQEHLVESATLHLTFGKDVQGEIGWE